MATNLAHELVSLPWERVAGMSPPLRPVRLVVDNQIVAPVSEETAIGARAKQAFILAESGSWKRAISTYDEVVTRFGAIAEPAIVEQVATCLFNKASLLVDAGQREQAITAYEEMWTRYESSRETPLRARAAQSLLNKALLLHRLNRPGEAAAYKQIIQRFGDAIELSVREVVTAALINTGIVLAEAGHHSEAVTTYDDVLARLANASEPALRAQAADTLLCKAFSLSASGYNEKAIASYNELLDRFDDLTKQACQALLDKGYILHLVGRGQEGIPLFDSVITRLGRSSNTDERELVVTALLNKGFQIGLGGDGEREIQIYDQLLRRFGKEKRSLVRRDLATAMMNKAFRLGELGQPEKEISIYADLIQEFGNDKEDQTIEQVAKASNNLGAIISKQGRPEEALSLYNHVIATLQTKDEGTLAYQFAVALNNKSDVLWGLSRHEEALTTSTVVIARFKATDDPNLRRQVVIALIAKADILRSLERNTDALEAYDLAARFASIAKSSATERFDLGAYADAKIMEALFSKAVLQGKLGFFSDSIATYDELTRRFGQAHDEELQVEVARGLFNKAIMFSQLGQRDDEIKTYDYLADWAGQSRSYGVIKEVAKSLVNKSYRLRESGKSDEAIKVADEVLRRFDPASDEPIRIQRGKALVNKGIAFLDRGSEEEAKALFRQAVEESEEVVQDIEDYFRSIKLPFSFKEAQADVTEDDLLNLAAAAADRIGERMMPAQRRLLTENFVAALKATRTGRSVEAAFLEAGVALTVDSRPKWRSGRVPEEIKGLTAPNFLRRVYADRFEDGVIRKDVVRSYDPDLMDAVETYIAQRKRRGRDLGDAKGLKFVARPARNKGRQEVLLRKQGITTADQVAELLRARSRRSAKKRRARRARNREPGV